MTEIIDLVDQDNNIIGITDVVTAHKLKQYHRVVGVFLFDPRGFLLLQNGNKYHKYDISVGGHVKHGESYDTAAKREMQEELGLDVPLTHISTFLPKISTLGHFWAIYCGKLPVDWSFSATEEVPSVAVLDIQEISLKLNASPELFTQGFINVFTEFNRINDKI